MIASILQNIIIPNAKQPPKPKVTKESDSSDSDSSDSDTSDSDEDEDNGGINSASRMTLPISSEISLKHGVKEHTG